MTGSIRAKSKKRRVLGDRFWGQNRKAQNDPRTLSDQEKAICWPFLKPSAGLEPATPSLPWRCSTN